VERHFDDATGPHPFNAIITVWRPYTAQEARGMADQHVDGVLEGYAETLVEWCGHEDDAASDVLALISGETRERLRDVLREITEAFAPCRYREAFDLRVTPDWWGPHLRAESEARDNRERADRTSAEWYTRILRAERPTQALPDDEGGEP
jgi:hypothetical protein